MGTKREPIWLFLYSSGNIAGCLAGLVGILLYLLGIIDLGWQYITGGLYASGYFAFATRQKEKALGDLSTDQLRDALNGLITQSSKRLPPEAVELLEGIRDHLDEILPRIAELRAAMPLDSPHTFTIAETVTRYLPDAIDSYLKLPPVYAVAHHIDGKTPRQHLISQLHLLEKKLVEITHDLFRGDAEALALNGRFLEEKFGKNSGINT